MGILEGNSAAREAVVIAAAVGVGFIVGFSMRHFVCKPLGRVNHKQQKDKAKVVDMVNMEDMGEKGVFCRCWKSGQFPYCDGTHETHNKITGDNVGPLIVKAKK